MTQAALFLIGVFGLPWILGFLWPTPTGPETVWAFLARFAPAVWLPTILALLLTGLMEGAAGLRKEIRARLGYSPESVPWFLLAVSLPIIATLFAVFSGRAADGASSFISSAAILPMIGIQVLTGAVGEELGWRGFLLPRLRKQFGETIAPWAMGILWSLWHVPAWFDPALPHHTWPVISPLLFITFFGVFMAFIFNRAGHSVLPTILAHLSLNITMGIGGVQLTSVVFWRVLAGVFGAVAVLATISSRRDPHNVPSPVGSAE